jgi:hypothetical protein
MYNETLPLFVRSAFTLERKPKFLHENGTFLNYHVNTRTPKHILAWNANETTHPVTYHSIIICDIKFEFEDNHEFRGDIYYNTVEVIKKVLKITSNEKVKTWINENFEEILYSARYWSIVHYVKKTEKLKSEIKELQNTIRFREIWTSVLSVEADEGGDLSKDKKRLLAFEFGMLESEYEKYIMGN